jgi:hypothetical protein
MEKDNVQVGIQKKKEFNKFSLTMQVRDKNGNSTGKTRSIDSDSSYEIAQFFEFNSFRKAKKKKTDRAEQISGQQAEEILASLYTEQKDESV